MYLELGEGEVFKTRCPLSALAVVHRSLEMDLGLKLHPRLSADGTRKIPQVSSCLNMWQLNRRKEGWCFDGHKP